MATVRKDIPTRTMSSNNTKQRWGTVAAAVANGETVVVESHGKPKLAVISIEAYREYLELREQERRAAILREFDALTERLSGRNADLTDEQVMEIAVRAVREVRQERAEEATREATAVESPSTTSSK